MKPRFTTPIRNRADSVKFIKQLHKANLLFHFDDDAFECLSNAPIDKATIRRIDKRVNEMFALPCWTFNTPCWVEDDTPYGIVIDIMEKAGQL